MRVSEAKLQGFITTRELEDGTVAEIHETGCPCVFCEAMSDEDSSWFIDQAGSSVRVTRLELALPESSMPSPEVVVEEVRTPGMVYTVGYRSIRELLDASPSDKERRAIHRLESFVGTADDVRLLADLAERAGVDLPEIEDAGEFPFQHGETCRTWGEHSDDGSLYRDCSERWCSSCSEWIECRGVLQHLTCPECGTPWHRRTS